MPWIESHTILMRHRKLINLAQDLRLKPVYIMGHLHALWHIALEQAEDGDLSQWSDEFIAASACYPGDVPQFVSLLQKHRWLDGKVIHDWLDYAGLFLTRKYSTSDPNKLKKIWKKHGRIYGNPRLKSKRTVSEQLLLAPNQPNQPNQPVKDLKDPLKKRGAVDKSVNNSVFNPEEKVVLEAVYKKTNIYALLEEFKNIHQVYPPKELLIRVCRQFLEKGEQIKEPYAYLKAVLHRAMQDDEHLKLKREPMAQSIKEILGIK